MLNQLQETDAEGGWSQVYSSSAEKVIGYKRNTHKPWLSDEAITLLKTKAAAKIDNNKTERN